MIQTPSRLPKRDHAVSSTSAMETAAWTSDNNNDDEAQSILVAATVLHDTLTRAHSSGNVCPVSPSENNDSSSVDTSEGGEESPTSTHTPTPTTTTTQQKKKHKTNKKKKNAVASSSKARMGHTPVVVVAKGPKSLSNKKKKGTFQYKRERNAREKARCLRLAQQVDELKDLILEGGWDVVKTTKAAVLNATAQYIRHLQTQIKESSNKALLLQQQQQQQQPATATKTPPKKAPLDQNKPGMELPPKLLLPYPTVQANVAGTPTQTFAIGLPPPPPTPAAAAVVLPGGASQACPTTTMLPVLMGLGTGLDYLDIFDCAPIGMAVASLGGAILGCNRSFGKLAGVSPTSLSTLSIFSLIKKEFLHVAYGRVSKMIGQDPTSSTSSSSSSDFPQDALFDVAARPGLALTISVVTSTRSASVKHLLITLVPREPS